MAALAAPQAKPVARAAPAAKRNGPAVAATLQPKLEVGPSHDRFEAEADRVAASVVSQSGPSAPPAISALSSGGASRRALQREEKRAIEKREKKPDPNVAALNDLIQSKPAPSRKQEEQKAQKKPAPKKRQDEQKVQAKAAPRPRQEEQKAQKKAAPKSKPEEQKAQKKAAPKSKPEEQKAQKKAAPKTRHEEQKVQTKAAPKPRQEEQKAQKKSANKTKPEEPKVQAKPMQGHVQRDNIDDDTVLETTIQAKPSAQRAVEKAEASIDQQPKEEKQPAQREAASSDGFTAPAKVESGIAALRGRGAPLSSEVRNSIEPRFGRDLSGVRVHDGAQAAQLSRDIHARAFTIGQDIFFGAGQYQPATSDGQALLAHEVTHTIQQSGGSAQAQPSRIQPSRIQRKPPGPAAKATTGTPAPAAAAGATPKIGEPFTHDVGELRLENDRRIVRIKSLPVPKVGDKTKGTGPGSTPAKDKPALADTFAEPWRYKGKTPRGALTARQAWLKDVGTERKGISDKIKDKAKASPSNVKRDGQEIVYLKSDIKSGDGQNFLLIGTAAELTATDEVRLPIWNREGRGTLFDVDHIQELQLGGMDGFPNFWLLEQKTNRSSGSNIAQAMSSDFSALIAAARTANFFKSNNVAEPSWENIRAGNEKLWEVEYAGIRNIAVTGDAANWTQADIHGGAHLQHITALSNTEIMDRGLIYEARPNHVSATIFALATGRGGFFRTVNYSDPDNVVATDALPNGKMGAGNSTGRAGKQFYRGFAVPSGGFTMTMQKAAPDSKKEVKPLLGSAKKLQPGTQIANIRGQPFPASGKITAPEINIPILWQPEFGFGGYAGKSWINELMGRLSIEGMSPIAVHEAGLSPQGELYAFGEIIATKALLPNLRVPIYLRGNEVGISFPIPTDRLNFGPVHATDAAIDVGFGEDGIFLGGHVGVVVDHVGSGTITARATRNDTILEGDFNFDLGFLDRPKAGLRYSFKEDKLTLNLEAGVKKGALPGVTSGRVTGSFSRDAVALSGTLNLAPPLEGSTLTLGYAKETGITIAGENIPLPVSKIPGVQNASLSARASFNPDDGSWRLSGSGQANFAIPPATGSLTVALNGPLIAIHGKASFQQGLAAGTLDVTATNAELDANGIPIEGRAANSFSITGRGSASLTFGILTGTAALELTRDGRVIITGTISLPPKHEVFPQRPYVKPLLHAAPPEFPIWGFSLGGIGVGVFAFVDAQLTADASVGPGTLENTAVSVKFDLQHPQDAVVDGTATFVVPASAGLTLDIGGGLRARAAVAYVQGRVGLDARLGLKAEGRANANIHWTRQEGLSLNARASATASPQFEVGVNASVKAGVDLGLFSLSKTWGPWRKKLGSFGPALAVGVTMPIAWSERTGLDFDARKIELTYPDIDFGAMMTDGFMKLI